MMVRRTTTLTKSYVLWQPLWMSKVCTFVAVAMMLPAVNLQKLLADLEVGSLRYFLESSL